METKAAVADDDKVKTTCIKFVGSDMIERVIHGNRSHIYRDILG